MNYAYVGNQLAIVNDRNSSDNQDYGFTDNDMFSNLAGDLNTIPYEYTYDNNGNLKADYNKGIENIKYNHLNLPKMIDLGNDNHIEYIYDAAGIKLKQKVYKDKEQLKEMDYIGNFVYENGSLAYIITDDGRLTPKDGGGYEYEYFIKDHLGNTRVTVKDSSGVAAVQQESHYYPFGMTMEGNSYQNPLQENLNKYLYNGKELQDDLGLNLIDYGARFYDMQIGRWHAIDPKAENYLPLSPYNYVANNPLILIDPNGMEVKHARFRDWLNTLWGRITNKEFRQDYKQLNASTETYLFKGIKNNKDGTTPGYGDSEGGEVSYNGKEIVITYGFGKQKDFTGNKSLSSMFHETAHGVQFDDGKGGFYKSGEEWKLFNGDMYDELEAFDASYTGGGYRKTYDELVTIFGDKMPTDTEAHEFMIADQNGKISKLREWGYDNSTKAQAVNSRSEKSSTIYCREYNPNTRRTNASSKILKVAPPLVSINNQYKW